jgi:hypothetical protein
VLALLAVRNALPESDLQLYSLPSRVPDTAFSHGHRKQTLFPHAGHLATDSVEFI